MRITKWFNLLLAVLGMVMTDCVTSSMRTLQSPTPGTKEYAATLTYMFFLTGAERCREKYDCVMPRDGYIRFGIDNIYNYSILVPQGTSFTCGPRFFNVEEGSTSKLRFCDINVPLTTSGPTTAPSSATPTGAPTPFPTKSPTLFPTTKSPTPFPTTRIPTKTPTAPTPAAPSLTNSPTRNPSRSPTNSPTRKPTRKPTSKPTLNPTLEPSLSPSKSPSTTPTQPITVAPTDSEQTESPTRSSSPTTDRPTRAPTNLGLRTSAPTDSATVFPSSSPTTKPTKNQNTTAICLGHLEETGCSGETFCVWTSRGCTLASKDVPTPNPTSTGSNAGDGSGLAWVTIVATNLAIIGIVISVSALVFIHIHRHKPVIQLSQTLFLQLICIGAIWINTSIFPSAFEPQSAALCIGRKWWFDLSLAFTSAVMMLKVWRVWRVFNAPVSKISHITNGYLLKGLAIFMFIDVVLLSLWTFVDPPYVEFSESSGANSCETGSTGKVFLALSYVFLVGLLVVTSFFAYRVKDLGSVIGESKQIFLISNNILMWGVFNVILYFSKAITENIRILVFTLSIFWCTTVGLFALLHAKYERFHLSREEILRSATEKKNSRPAYGRPQGHSTDNRYSGNTAQSNTGNTGFLDQQEVIDISGNAAAVHLRPQQFPNSSREFAGSNRNLYAHSSNNAGYVNERDFRELATARGANTDNAPRVSFRDLAGRRFGGSFRPSMDQGERDFDDTVSESPIRRHNRQEFFSSAASVPGEIETGRSRGPVSVEYFSENRSQPNFYRPREDRVLFRASTNTLGKTQDPTKLPPSKSARNFPDLDTLKEGSIPTSEQGSMRNSFSAAKPLTTQISYRKSDEVDQVPSKPSSAGSVVAPESTVSTASSGSSNPIVSNGFKIGERGKWEEYVHRVTGESFWLHMETGEISKTAPVEGAEVNLS